MTLDLYSHHYYPEYLQIANINGCGPGGRRRDLQLQLEGVEEHLRVQGVNQETLGGCGAKVSARRRKLEARDSNLGLEGSRGEVAATRARKSDGAASGGVVAIFDEGEVA